MNSYRQWNRGILGVVSEDVEFCNRVAIDFLYFRTVSKNTKI